MSLIADTAARMLSNIFGRVDGTLAMRLVVQPLMATILAARDGVKDARQHRAPYGWSLIADSGRRGHRLREGWRSIRKVFLAALIVDVVYQVIELGWIYIGEALIMAEMLAVLPYVLLRGPANRIARCLLPRLAARRA